jgi:hypothetical protein
MQLPWPIPLQEVSHLSHLSHLSHDRKIRIWTRLIMAHKMAHKPVKM